MTERRLYLDRSFGEVRGVVTLDDQPERLIIRRDGDDSRLLLGARLVARVAALEPTLSSAFLDLGRGAEAILPYKSENKPVRGQSLEVEIRSEPRRGKLAVARWVGEAEGDPRLIEGSDDVALELSKFARSARVVEGAEARRMADEAESDALEVLHALPGGGVLSIEPTRALTAIDVDLGERKGADAKRVARQANLQAVQMSARLLRLKALGGIVVIDLVGRGHDGAALMTAARTSFAPDNPGVAIGPVGRFGTMELSLPRRARPIIERLCDPDGRLSAETLALRLVRRLEDEAAAEGGARLVGRCAPDVATRAEPLVKRLREKVGARVSIEPNPASGRDLLEVIAS